MPVPSCPKCGQNHHPMVRCLCAGCGFAHHPSLPCLPKSSACCGAPLTVYDKGNGEKYLACYRCYAPVLTKA